MIFHFKNIIKIKFKRRKKKNVTFFFNETKERSAHYLQYVLVLCGGVQLVKNYRPTVKCREAIDNWYEGKIEMALTVNTEI